MRRIRVKATIDRDSASPDSIRAASEYLITQIEERADITGQPLDWNTWRTFNRRDRHGDMLIVHWVKVLRS